MDIRTQTLALFDAERETRRLHRGLAEAGQRASESLHGVLVAELNAARALDQQEGALRLVRIAALLQDIDGDKAADSLIEILNVDWPEARLAAGEALEAKLFTRFKEVALAIERALDKYPSGSVALVELPYLIGEVQEPSSLKLLGKFLKHADADVVASAIEALVEMQDPDAIALLTPLQSDGRRVTLEDDDENDEVTIGELAAEACEQLEGD
jgi:HEAT repeat protein